MPGSTCIVLPQTLCDAAVNAIVCPPCSVEGCTEVFNRFSSMLGCHLVVMRPSAGQAPAVLATTRAGTPDRPSKRIFYGLKLLAAASALHFVPLARRTEIGKPLKNCPGHFMQDSILFLME